MRLYKYVTADRIDILKKGCIRFSSPKALNDPFELCPHIAQVSGGGSIDGAQVQKYNNVLREHFLSPRRENSGLEFPASLLRSAIESPDIAERDFMLERFLATVVQHKFQDGLNQTIGILCLSERPDSLLMWSHYADAHQGFVIEFDSDTPFFDQRITISDELRHLRKVVYEKKRPSLGLMNLTSTALFLTKSEEWSYELEWRMLMPLDQACEIRSSTQGMVHLFEFPKNSIKRLIFGCRMTEQKKQEIKEILFSESAYTHVTVTQSVLDEEHYSLNLLEIPLSGL
ncbi:MAG: DUF2971 domain-containing protein [Sulfuricella sp.]|nr:DUF2971 domain-containing protein [Sulfuricella sp.]